MHRQAAELLKAAGEEWEPVGDDTLAKLLAELAARGSGPLDAESLFAEWQHVIQAQGLLTWAQYRSASRAGRGRALTLKDRKAIWEVVEQFQQHLLTRRQTSFSGLCQRAAALLKTGAAVSPYDAQSPSLEQQPRSTLAQAPSLYGSIWNDVADSAIPGAAPLTRADSGCRRC